MEHCQIIFLETHPCIKHNCLALHDSSKPGTAILCHTHEQARAKSAVNRASNR